MTVDPRLRKKGKGGGALMLNIRVRHIRKRGSPPTTREQVRDALQALLDSGRMPKGWQFMYIDWKNPRKYGNEWESGWPAGNHSEEFDDAFTKVVQDQIRLAEVRKL